MDVIVDTNVPKVANGDASQASSQCVAECARWIRDIMRNKHTLLLDHGWEIIREYRGQLRSEGQFGLGKAFLEWVEDNWEIAACCQFVRITPQESDGRMSFAEFPADPELADFDPSDRKFVAVAWAHPTPAPILNAVDTDWWHYRKSLEAHGIQIEFLCPDEMGHNNG